MDEQGRCETDCQIREYDIDIEPFHGGIPRSDSGYYRNIYSDIEQADGFAVRVGGDVLFPEAQGVNQKNGLGVDHEILTDGVDIRIRNLELGKGLVIAVAVGNAAPDSQAREGKAALVSG